ncbi:CCA-adding enzyme [Kroppenstedtia guangzhouensis]|uniref:CCA-adding enzyme n=1 Tax=Kroppenstedtia guangzhouensis TaxID=1274356 RepID=A0ABQ1G7Z8_9BACL|nr:CCA tRNA nucleotidyltransferase [Kroppenstedtia guangzhouensis]GGA38544.1 CCA-adding enzyme [Kroppenstedtia guangzhouensis]
MKEARKASLQVLERLEEAGFQAYWVGGCVRDELLNREPTDYDVATDAPPEKVQSLFAKTVATGIQHGTVTVLIHRQAVEVTTFREETGYRDHRHPGQVQFIKRLETDLARRDFTINAMARDRRGCLIDPFGGEKDLQSKLVRAVGEAEERFQEDALRMVRALRFCAQLRFRLDEQTKVALIRQKSLLRYLVVERVTQELEKLWATEKPSRGIRPLWEMGLFPHLPPFTRWGRVVGDPAIPVEEMDRRIGRWARWALFLHLCGVHPEKSKPHLRSFRLPAKDVEIVSSVYRLGFQWQLTPIDGRTGKQFLLTHGKEKLESALETAAAIHRWDAEEEEGMREALIRWQREMPVHHLRELRVNGRSLMEATGRKPGPWTGRVLNTLLKKVALGELPNEAEALIEEGCRLVQQDS